MAINNCYFADEDEPMATHQFAVMEQRRYDSGSFITRTVRELDNVRAEVGNDLFGVLDKVRMASQNRAMEETIEHLANCGL